MLMQEILITENGLDINAVQDTASIVYDNSDMFVAYINANHEAVAARRDGSGSWTSSTLRTETQDDAHNGAACGVSPDGIVHVCADMHNSTLLLYWRSASPRDVTTLAPSTMGGTTPTSTTYPRFYRAGDQFYFLYRDGMSASGDVCVKRYVSGAWVDLAIPLLRGSTLTPTDNAYLGQCQGLPNGDLLIVWTHRISWWNQGVGFARYQHATGQWVRSDGTPYTLPITRTTAELVVDTTDQTVSNVSLSVSQSASGQIYVAHSRFAGGESREIFFSAREPGGWRTTQVSAVRALRLQSSCPGGPTTGPPRPCEMDLMGPTMIVEGSNIGLLWSRAVQPSRGVWARPPGLVSSATSTDGGKTWRVVEERRDVEHLVGELPRETSGRPTVLIQEADLDGTGRGRLSAGVVTAWHRGAPFFGAILTTAPPPLEVADPSLDLWAPGEGLTASVWCLPNPTGREMTLFDKGGAGGAREIRLMLWAGNPTGTSLIYDPTRVQVLIGDGAGGWGILAYPVMTVLPGTLTHLCLVWDRGVGITVYVNGTAASLPYTGIPAARGQRLALGANRTAAGTLERFYDGWANIAFWRSASTADQIRDLFEGGPGAGRF